MAIHSVTNQAQWQAAVTAAVPGDEIIIENNFAATQIDYSGKKGNASNYILTRGRTRSVTVEFSGYAGIRLEGGSAWLKFEDMGLVHNQSGPNSGAPIGINTEIGYDANNPSPAHPGTINHHLEFRRLDIRVGRGGSAGIHQFGNMDYITVEHCTFGPSGNFYATQDNGFGGSAVSFLWGSNWDNDQSVFRMIFRNNFVWRFGQTSPTFLDPYNEDNPGPPGSQTDGNGVIFDYQAVTGYNGLALVENNLFVDILGHGVVDFSSSTKKVIIRNNTFVDCAKGAYAVGVTTNYGGLYGDPTQEIYNNVYYITSGKPALAGGGGSGSTFRNNLVHAPSGGGSSNAAVQSGTITSNPLFVNYTGGESGDYRLSPASPARGAGLASWSSAVTGTTTTAPTTTRTGLSWGSAAPGIGSEGPSDGTAPPTGISHSSILLAISPPDSVDPLPTVPVAPNFTWPKPAVINQSVNFSSTSTNSPTVTIWDLKSGRNLYATGDGGVLWTLTAPDPEKTTLDTTGLANEGAIRPAWQYDGTSVGAHNSSVTSPTGVVDLRWSIQLTDLAGEVLRGICGQDTYPTDAGFYLRWNNLIYAYEVMFDVGTGDYSANRTATWVPPSFPDGHITHRLVYNPLDGTMVWYESSDKGSSWEIVEVDTVAPAPAIRASTAPVRVGAIHEGSWSSPGYFYWVECRAGEDGEVAWRFDPDDPGDWILTGAGSQIVTLPGTGFVSAPDANTLTPSGKLGIVVEVTLDDWSGIVQTLVGKGETYPDFEYIFRVEADGSLRLFCGATQAISLPLNLEPGTRKWLRAEREGITVSFAVSDDGADWTDVPVAWKDMDASPFINTSAPLSVGTLLVSGFEAPFAGTIHEARILDGTTTIAHFAPALGVGQFSVNPSKVFTELGTYPVTLHARNALGGGSITKTVQVVEDPGPPRYGVLRHG